MIMDNERVYLEIVPSSEKKGMVFISCLGKIGGRIIGYLHRSNKICYDLDRYLTGEDNLGTYFYNEEDALACISEFYIIKEEIN